MSIADFLDAAKLAIFQCWLPRQSTANFDAVSLTVCFGLGSLFFLLRPSKEQSRPESISEWFLALLLFVQSRCRYLWQSSHAQSQLKIKETAFGRKCANRTQKSEKDKLRGLTIENTAQPWKVLVFFSPSHGRPWPLPQRTCVVGVCVVLGKGPHHSKA